jgi:hypothetical protein
LDVSSQRRRNGARTMHMMSEDAFAVLTRDIPVHMSMRS